MTKLISPFLFLLREHLSAGKSLYQVLVASYLICKIQMVVNGMARQVVEFILKNNSKNFQEYPLPETKTILNDHFFDRPIKK